MTDRPIVMGSAKILDKHHGYSGGWREGPDGLFCSACGKAAYTATLADTVTAFIATDWCGKCGAWMGRYTRVNHHGENGSWKNRRNGKIRCSLCGAERINQDESYCTSCGAKME